MNKRIHENEMQQVPVMLILGDKDIENSTVRIRRHGEGGLGAKTLDEAIAYFHHSRTSD